MPENTVNQEARVQRAPTSSLGHDIVQHPSPALRETTVEPLFCSSYETTSGLLESSGSVGRNSNTTGTLRLPQTKQNYPEPTLLPAKPKARKRVDDQVTVSALYDTRTTPKPVKCLTHPLDTTHTKVGPISVSKSSQSSPSTCTSLSGVVPSHFGPALKMESSRSPGKRNTPPSLSKLSSPVLNLQSPLTGQVKIHHHKATDPPSLTGNAGMAPPASPATIGSPQNALNQNPNTGRRREQTRNYQSRFPAQEDHIHWREYSLLNLYVRNLPNNVTTLQIWRNFKKFGELFNITINDNSAHQSKTATICYKPPPAIPFWQKIGGVHYQHGDKTSRFVQVSLDKRQSMNRTITSPIRPAVKYNEEHTLIGERIDFGVLIGPHSFLALRTREADKILNVKFHLNLYKQEITVYFPSPMRSEKSGLVVREYRFRIALDQNFALSQLEDSEDKLILFLDIDKPPPYSRKLNEAATGSHVDDARRWSEEDLWARQTDIADTKEALISSGQIPVSVKNSHLSIDIGRWLAFRLSFSRSQENIKTFAIMQSALRDFNVSIKDESQLKMRIATPADEPVIWKALDKHDTTRNATASSSLLESMMSQVTLSFPVRYQLEVCVSHGYLGEYTITEAFLSQLAALPEAKALQFLKAVDSRGQRFLQPMQIFEDLEFCRPVKKPKLPDNCIEIHHATVTATTIYFNTPSVEITNRVIRQYKHHADRFLRVRFEDDDYRGSTRLYPSVNNKMTNIFTRVRRTLKHGIVVGDRHYQFLAWGNSQLREHATYFFADLPGVVTANDIRAKMGEFSKEKIVAKCAARMGQCFSTTRPLTCRIPRVHESVCIPDIKTADGRYTFTDGVGKMSDMVATLAGIQMGFKDEVPSVIQFRLGGCKGVLAVDPGMQGAIDIRVRESQFKFASASNDLEIIRCSNFANADLNRQIILVLSELGVPNSVFLGKQEELIKTINKAMRSDEAAVKALLDRVDPNLMTPVIANLVGKGGFRAANEPFVTAVLHLWRTWSLKYLKEKAKLPIPKSAFVLGCTDETQTLRGHFDDNRATEDTPYEELERNLPEIFLQVTDPHTRKVRVVEGICIVARNPSLHRGDVRVVKAVDVPALHHLRDAVVFPQTGDRDLPSMCSGGDLDGDDFIVIWDEDLLPVTWNVKPFHYDPPVPRQAEGAVTTEQIISFFLDYMENDFLGRIATAHLAWADDKGVGSDQCLELVQLHSLSVDFPKTGVPAPMEKRLQRVDGKPHFMEKKGKRYHSGKILGQLYDAVEKVKFKPDYKMSFDPRILNAIKPPEAIYQHARILKGAYDESMRQIMAQHQIKTEFEVWTTFVLNHSKKSNDFKFHEEIGRLSAALKEQYFDEIADLMHGRDLAHLAPFAVAAYQITQMEVDIALKHDAQKSEDEEGQEVQEENAEMPFISFPWVLHETLIKIAAGVLQRVDDGNTPNEAGISFDKDGNAVFSDLAGNLLPLQGNSMGQRHADPFRNELKSANEDSERVRPTSPEPVRPTSSKSDEQVVPNGIEDPSKGGSESVESRMKMLLVEDSDSD